jgi:uncharacterized membrane protein (UPF0127 family)
VIEMARRSGHLSAMKCFVLIGLLGVMAAAGCEQKVKPAPPGPQLPTHAQAKLPAIRLWLGAAEVSAEMALTGIQQETGMMFRTNLDENAGMIFPLPHLERASFWMTNCPLSLAAAYINPQGEILEIHELHANDPNPVEAQSRDILYVLEVNHGWFDRHHIVPGTVVRTERGTLRETFRRQNP